MTNQQFDSAEILRVLRLLGNTYLKKFKTDPVPRDEKAMIDLFHRIETEAQSIFRSELKSEIPFADGELEENKQTAPLDLPKYWVFDAMDGAVQYMRHLPGWTFNLALIVNKEVQLAAVFDPLQDEMFWAERGKGAYLNEKAIAPFARPQSAVMMAATSHPPFPGRTPGLSANIATCDQRLLDTYSFLRNFGPTALQICNVAAGRIDVFAQEGLDTFNWLPGILIAREAGAAVLNLLGENWSWGDESLLVGESSVTGPFLCSRKPNEQGRSEGN